MSRLRFSDSDQARLQLVRRELRQTRLRLELVYPAREYIARALSLRERADHLVRISR